VQRPSTDTTIIGDQFMDDHNDAPNRMSPAGIKHRQYQRMRVGSAIQELRIQRGLSRTELAKRSGVSLSHISRIENGLTMPSYSMVESLADGLQADLSHFTQFTDRSSRADGIIDQVLSATGVPDQDLDLILRTSLKAREILAGLFADPDSIPDV
jgi:transcriptional regulator with XRE-family HTH domain